MIKKILVVTILTFSLAVIARSQSFDKIALKINGKPITLGEFNYLFTKNRAANAAVDSQQLADYVKLFVDYKLKVEATLSKKMDTTSAFRSELAGYRAQLASQYLTDTTADARVLNEAYGFMQYDLRASHILVALSPGATPSDTLIAYNRTLELRAMILANAPFDSLARAFSTDPSAKSNGGDLGYFTAFRMVYPFERAAYRLSVGEVSPPVRTKFGYHIIKLTDKRKARGEVKVAHIMVLIPRTGSETDWANGLARISSVREKIMRGADFGQLAAEVSDDKGTAQSGGVLPQFGIGRILPTFEDGAFALTTIGEVSMPIRSQAGWHLIKLLEKHPVGSFSDVKGELKEKISRDERILAGQTSFVATLKKKYGYKLNQQNIDAIANLLDTTFSSGKWSAEVALKMKKNVFTFANQKVSQYQFAQYLQTNQGQPIEDAKLFANEALIGMSAEKLLAFESEKLEKAYPNFRFLMNEYHDGILLFDISDKTVWSKASKDSSGLVAFYERNKANYLRPLITNAAVAIFSDSTTAMHAKADLMEMDLNSMVLDSLKGLMLNKYQATNFSSGSYNPSDHQLISKVNPLVPGIHFLETGNQTSCLVIVKSVEKDYVPALDEIRGVVISGYQDELDQLWVKQLRLQFPVVVNWAVISTLVKK